ncbi:unnamed protein product [Lasius platythorax]|uniref:G-protein coupled receptors family 2 profile 2 domain-containing protein n=1 Tax=Lasius platythorax TaxID=488582 RepID=A0AAV2P6Y7_9HYME
MCEKNFGFWCCALLLLVSSSSKSQENSTNNEEKDDNLTIRYELDMNSTTNYGDEMKTLDLYEKFTNNTQYDEMQYEFYTTSTSNNREDDDSIQYKLDKHSIQNHEDDEQIPMKSHANSTNVSHQRNITSQEVYGNLIEKNGSMADEFFIYSSEDSNESNIVPYEICDNITCIPFCCSLGDRLDDDECIPEKIKYSFPNVYGYTNDSFQGENKTVDELFQLTVHDPCQGNDRFLLPEGHQYDYKIFANGSLYLSHYEKFAKTYCLAIVDGDEFEVTICSETSDEILKTINNNSNDVRIIYVSFHIVSILLLVSVFLVYSILPELRNVHGFMLRNYSGALFVAYIIDIVNIIIKADDVQHSVCITIAFFNYFLFLTSFFWLIMISFDMWWTFRGFCSLQRNSRQRGKKKLVYYAIYAWGCPFIFAIISVIMDSVSKDIIPKILQPEFHEGDCWFLGKETFALYYYGLKSFCIFSSICLSISTALKIARYEKDTGLRLSDSESKRYNDNKKWFNLYLKLFIVLFIVMGIKWSIMTVSWLFGDISNYVSYVINLVDIIQNLCTFIIFVWKKKIKRMLLKRFDCGLFPKAGCETNVTSSTCTTSEVSLQEKMSSCKQENHHLKGSSVGTEF